MASIVQYLSIIVMALYLLSMLVGFVAGKVYILEMSHVLQLTFLSIVCLNKVIPTFASLSFLKFIFAYITHLHLVQPTSQPKQLGHKSHLVLLRFLRTLFSTSTSCSCLQSSLCSYLQFFTSKIDRHS